AGATEETARRVAERVQPIDGMDTAQIRTKVGEELRRERADLADAYLRTVLLKSRASPELTPGNVRVPEALPRIPAIAQTQNARVGFGNKWAQVSVQRALKTREVWMNQADLQRLGAGEGSRVAVQFPRGVPPPAPGAPRLPP
ncbi:MAG TPA: hypothetical protein VGR51_09165, partial [Thermoplasmata archaeon]|nr:hypothetical protein [Thermoplasmata archaeon]